MALIKCEECKKEISTEAQVCPHCGFKPKRTSTFTWVIAGFFALAFAIGINNSATDRSSVPQPAASPETPEQIADRETAKARRTATAYCMQFIKQKLHDPGSAEFAHSSGAEVTIKGKRAVVVRSVRAKNAFGAMRKTEFVCLLDLDLDGNHTRSFLTAERGKQTPQSDAFIASFLDGKAADRE